MFVSLSHVRLNIPSGIFSSGSPTKMMHVVLISVIRATCLDHLIFLKFIILIIFGEISYEAPYNAVFCILLLRPIS
jgi:hypothetical protein